MWQYALMSAAVAIAFMMIRDRTVRSSAKPVTSQVGNSKYLPPAYQVQVDRWDATQGTDQSMGVGMGSGSRGTTQLSDVYDSNLQWYSNVANSSPGVRLVQHAVL